MLSKNQIQKLFELLNVELSKKGELGEVGIVGGAVMCLVFDVRKSTKDVDAIFKPVSLIRKLAAYVGEENGVDPDWLNDAAKRFVTGQFEKTEVLNLSHLRVWAPEPRYMLAMKCLSARWDSLDKTDVIYLLKMLKLNKKEQVFKIIETFFPKNKIPAKTQFFIEEILNKK